MESYTITHKQTETVHYVLKMAQNTSDFILLANVETGELRTTTLQALTAEFEFNDLLLEESAEDDSQEEEENSEFA